MKILESLINRRTLLKTSVAVAVAPSIANAALSDNPGTPVFDATPTCINVDMDDMDVVFYTELRLSVLSKLKEYPKSGLTHFLWKDLQDRRRRTSDTRPICFIVDRYGVQVNNLSSCARPIMHIAMQVFAVKPVERDDYALVIKDRTGTYRENTKYPIRYSGTVSSV